MLDYEQWIKLDTAAQLNAVAKGEFAFIDTSFTKYDAPEIQAKKAEKLLDALNAKLQETENPDDRDVIEWEAASKFRGSIVASCNANPSQRPEPFDAKTALHDLDLMRGLNENSNAERIAIVDDATGTVSYL